LEPDAILLIAPAHWKKKNALFWQGKGTRAGTAKVLLEISCEKGIGICKPVTIDIG